MYHIPYFWKVSLIFCHYNDGLEQDCSMSSALAMEILQFRTYRQTSNIRRTSVCNKIVGHSDVVGASPVGAAPTTSSFST